MADENKGKYPPPPSEFNKLGNIRIVSIPYIIPLIKGADITEGSIDNSNVIGKVVAYHGAAAEWLCLMNMEACCNTKVWCGEGDNQCPRPNNNKNVSLSYNGELFIKVLMGASKNSVAYRTVKNLVDDFKIKELEKYRLQHPEEAIPKGIDLDYKTSASVSTASTKLSYKSSTSEDVKIVNKNGNLLSFLQILFCREGNGDEIMPATMTDEAMEIMGSSEKNSEQARLTADNITAKVDEIGTERSYISRYTRFPFLSHTLISYMLQSHFHNGAIDSNLESLKKSFSILTLLPLPHDCNDELSSFMNSSRNVEVEQILDQPADKRAGIRKEVFLKGRQKNLDDVIVFIVNIIALGRFWVKVNDDDSPMVLNMLMDIADLLSSTEYKSFDDKYKSSKNYMAHTLVVYIFNIFAVFC